MGKSLAVISVIAGFALVVAVIIHIHFGTESQPFYAIDFYSLGLVLGVFIWAVSLVCLAFGFKQSR
jgi:hypothetical protein